MLNQDDVKKYIDLYNATGRIAYHYPRKHKISLNGGPQLPEKEAIVRIKIILLIK
jgi:hypothetical protein